MSRFTGEYAPNWATIAANAKVSTGWKCERCGHPDDRKSGHVLTVHHLDGDKANNVWWNLAVLCQRCHLRIQGKVVMRRAWMFEHSPWFKPHAAGYYAHLQHLPEDREYIRDHMDELLKWGMGQANG